VKSKSIQKAVQIYYPDLKKMTCLGRAKLVLVLPDE